MYIRLIKMFPHEQTGFPSWQELEQQHLVEYKLKKDQDMLVPGAQLVALGPCGDRHGRHGRHGLEARVGYDGEGAWDEIGMCTMGNMEKQGDV